MGDITGRPKAPETKVVYVPQYIETTPTSTNTNTTTTTTTGTGTDTDTTLTPEKQREKSLLGRTRSRVGTILTSFRGILSPLENQSSNQRKTLLGE